MRSQKKEIQKTCITWEQCKLVACISLSEILNNEESQELQANINFNRAKREIFFLHCVEFHAINHYPKGELSSTQENGSEPSDLG